MVRGNLSRPCRRWISLVLLAQCWPQHRTQQKGVAGVCEQGSKGGLVAAGPE